MDKHACDIPLLLFTVTGYRAHETTKALETLFAGAALWVAGFPENATFSVNVREQIHITVLEGKKQCHITELCKSFKF